MDKIWTNRLIGGTKTWDDVSAARRRGVLSELKNRVQNGTITAERYEEITGEVYVA